MARLLIIEDNHALAALLLSAARDRGYEAVAAPTGEAALRALEEARPDAAVVDLLLPDMPGTRLLDLLAAREVPAVAMSGVFKGSPFAEMSVKKHGATAFFEKPFDLAQLLDAVDRARGVAPEELPEIALEVEHEDALGDLPGFSAVEGAGLLSASLEAGTEDEASVPSVDVLSVHLPFAQRAQVWERQTHPPPGRRARVARTWKQSGSLAEEQVPSLVNAFHEARFTGEVRLRRGNVVKVLGFERGRAVSAASNLVQERFARVCVRRGAVPEARLAEVAAIAEREGLRTGEALVRLGLLGAAQREALLVEQVKEIAWSTFSWREGQYEVAARRALRPGTVPLSLFPGDLILEGVIRTARLVTLREQVPRTRHLTPTADPPYALQDLHFTGPQAHLLAYSDGSKSVEDLLALSDLPERDALATLHALELLGLLEERQEPSRPRRISFGL